MIKASKYLIKILHIKWNTWKISTYYQTKQYSKAIGEGYTSEMKAVWTGDN